MARRVPPRAGWVVFSSGACVVVSCGAGEALLAGFSDGSGEGVADASPDGEIVTVPSEVGTASSRSSGPAPTSIRSPLKVVIDSPSGAP